MHSGGLIYDLAFQPGLSISAPFFRSIYLVYDISLAVGLDGELLSIYSRVPESFDVILNLRIIFFLSFNQSFSICQSATFCLFSRAIGKTEKRNGKRKRNWR